MIGLELSLALLQQRPREPQELFDLLVQVAIILVIILIPAAKALYESVQRRQRGEQPPPARPAPPEGLGRERAGRVEGLDLFQELLRGGPAAGGPGGAGAQGEPGPAEAPFGAFDPDAVQEARRPSPAEVAAERREEAQRARQRERALRRAAEAQREQERAQRRAERGTDQRELQRAERASREPEGDRDERSAASRAERSSGLELESLAVAVPRARRPIFARERTRAGWRDAVVLAEVLGAPLALRDPRRSPGSHAPRGD